MSMIARNRFFINRINFIRGIAFIEISFIIIQNYQLVSSNFVGNLGKETLGYLSLVMSKAFLGVSHCMFKRFNHRKFIIVIIIMIVIIIILVTESLRYL